MARITAFMKTTDQGRISSVVTSPLDVPHLEQVKRKLVYRPRRLIDTPFQRKTVVELLVSECTWHPPGVATLPVVLMGADPGPKRVWRELGVARVCPLCWMVITPPPGAELPLPLPVVTTAKKKPLPVAVVKPRGPRAITGPSLIELRRFHTIRAKMSTVNTFTSHDVMGWLGTTRTAGLPYLKRLMASNEIEIVVQGGGPGNMTIYRKKVLKKDIEMPKISMDKGAEEEKPYKRSLADDDPLVDESKYW